MTSIILTVVLIGSLIIILMNKMGQRQGTNTLPTMNTLEDKQDYLRDMQQRSRLSNQEWLFVILSYYAFEKLAEMESVQQAQEWLHDQSPETITAQVNSMMNDESFLESMIADLPDELMAAPDVYSDDADIKSSDGDYSDGGDGGGGGD